MLTSSVFFPRNRFPLGMRAALRVVCSIYDRLRECARARALLHLTAHYILYTGAVGPRWRENSEVSRVARTAIHPRSAPWKVLRGVPRAAVLFAFPCAPLHCICCRLAQCGLVSKLPYARFRARRWEGNFINCSLEVYTMYHCRTWMQSDEIAESALIIFSYIQSRPFLWGTSVMDLRHSVRSGRVRVQNRHMIIVKLEACNSSWISKSLVALKEVHN